MVAVSNHSRTKAAEYIAKHIDSRLPVSHTAALKAAAVWIAQYYPIVIRTHSALKAAGLQQWAAYQRVL